MLDTSKDNSTILIHQCIRLHKAYSAAGAVYSLVYE